MKKYFISFPLVAILIFTMQFSSLATETTFTSSTNDTIATPYVYPVTPVMDEWKNFNSHSEMIQACQIPEDILSCMSTEALAETVVNYPLLSDMLAWSDATLGFQSVLDSFNGLQELLAREDGVTYLLNTSPMLCSQELLEVEDNFDERNKVRCISRILNNTVLQNNISSYNLPVVQSGEVRTPAGSYVEYYKNLDFVDLNNLFNNVPFTQNDFDDIERSYKVNYPKATKIGPISPRYNCHSYAWYSTSPNNNYWFVSLPYITDGSYYRISLDRAEGRDILLYNNQRQTIIHSALIDYVVNNDLYVTSKWDFMGVYEHRYDYCPYYISKGYLASYTR